jgi:hypothetical protein
MGFSNSEKKGWGSVLVEICESIDVEQVKKVIPPLIGIKCNGITLLLSRVDKYKIEYITKHDGKMITARILLDEDYTRISDLEIEVW